MFHFRAPARGDESHMHSKVFPGLGFNSLGESSELRLGYTGKCGGSDSSTIAIVNYIIIYYLYIYMTHRFFLTNSA